MGARPTWKRMLVPLAILAVAALVFTPAGIGFSQGIHSGMDNVPAEFATQGCTACHGGPDHEYGTGDPYSFIDWSFQPGGEETAPIRGNTYANDGVYLIHINFTEQNNPDAGNHAGFNLRASAGTLEAVEEVSQVNEDGTQATHVGPGLTSWQVRWTAPAEGVAVFDLFINDVNGDANADIGDQVYRIGWYLTDAEGAVPGAVEEEEEFHVGVPLPQYWLGLIALAGMTFILVFGFVYLKFFNPHHTDPKDR